METIEACAERWTRKDPLQKVVKTKQFFSMRYGHSSASEGPLCCESAIQKIYFFHYITAVFVPAQRNISKAATNSKKGVPSQNNTSFVCNEPRRSILYSSCDEDALEYVAVFF